MRIRAIARILLISSGVFLAVAAMITLYASSYLGALHKETIAAESPPTQRAGLLGEVERAMGMRGAAGSFARFARTGDETALADAARYLAQADGAITAYAERLPDGQASTRVRDLRTILNNFRLLYRQADETGASERVRTGVTATLEQMTSLIQALHNQEVMMRFDGAARMLSYGQGVVLVLLLGAFGFALTLAMVARIRIFGPLEVLGRDVHDLSIAIEQGRHSVPVLCGAERQDEIGTIVRAVERLRGAVSGQSARPVNDPRPEATLSAPLAGPAAEAFNKVLADLKAAADDLVNKGAALEKARDESAAAIVEGSTRTTAAVDALNDLHRDMGRFVAEGREDLGRMTAQLQGVSDEVRATEETVKTSADRIMSKLDDGVSRLGAATDGAGERVAVALSVIDATRDALAEAAGDAGTATEALKTTATDLTGHLQESAAMARRDSARFSDMVAEFLREAGGTAQVMTTNAASLDDTCARVLDRMADTAGQVEAIAARFAIADDQYQEGHAVTAQTDGRMAEAVDGLKAMIEERMTRLDERTALHGEILEDVDVQSERTGEILETLGDVVRAATDRLARDGQSVSSLTDRFDTVVGRIADSLTQIVGQVGRAVDEQGMTHTALARKQDQVRDMVQTISQRLDDIARAMDESLAGADTDGDQLLETANTLFTGKLGDLARQIEALVHVVQRGVPEPQAAARLETRLAGLSGRIDDLVDRLSETDTPPGRDGAAETGAEIVRMRDDVLGRLDALSAQLRAGVPAAPIGPEVLEGMSRRIAAEARAAFEALEAGQGSQGTEAAPQAIEPVIRSLKDMAEAAGAHAAGSSSKAGSRPSLAGAARDVGLLADAVQGLERQAETLTRVLADPSGPEENETPLSEAELVDTLGRLHEAMARMGHIAETITLAHDTARLRSAG